MHSHLAEQFASELINVRSDAELDGALGQVSRRLGFDHFALSLETRSASRDDPGLLLQSLVVSALFDGLIGFGDIIRWRDTA